MMMRHAGIPDEILQNILSRLPGKDLLGFRCVSRHWNRLISDPYFMNSRSRPMILLPNQNQNRVAVLDDNDDNPHSIIVNKIHSPLQLESHRHAYTGTKVSIVGTFNGIVILALTGDSYLRTYVYLYNPLTAASKILWVMNRPCLKYPNSHVFGFSYDDLKIVRFAICDNPYLNWFPYDVFDLKTSLWSKPENLTRDFEFWSDTGMFINGFLYWVILVSFSDFEILALNLKEMIFSRIYLPSGCRFYNGGSGHYKGTLLGSLNGCLCMIYKNDTITFDMWVMKEQGVQNLWFKATSFTLGFELGNFDNEFHPTCILSNGKILLTNGSHQLVIFDTITGSYKMLENLVTDNTFKKIEFGDDFNGLHSIEYVESLISPSDICLR